MTILAILLVDIRGQFTFAYRTEEDAVNTGLLGLLKKTGIELCQ